MIKEQFSPQIRCAKRDSFVQVRRLEGLLVTVQEDYTSKLKTLGDELRTERDARRKAEADLDALKRQQHRW